MSEEPEKKNPDHLQREADRAKPSKKVSVLNYLTILFAAAFVLLLWSYFMPQRKNEELISGRKESVSAMQSIEDLQNEKKDLSAQVDQLQQKLDEKSKELTDEQKSAEKLELQLDAMDWLREIQALYEKKYYKAARAMIAEFEDTGLPGYLPDVSLHSYDGNENQSPLEEYETIVEKLD
jgi:uncharacterized protein HemX